MCVCVYRTCLLSKSPPYYRGHLNANATFWNALTFTAKTASPAIHFPIDWTTQCRPTNWTVNRSCKRALRQSIYRQGSLVVSIVPDNFLMTFDAPFNGVYPDERYAVSFLTKCCNKINSVRIHFLGYPAAPVFKKISEDAVRPPTTAPSTASAWPTVIARGPRAATPCGRTMLLATVAVLFCLLYLRQ